MSTFQFDKEKYLQIMKKEGIAAALSQLHKDTTRWEFLSFEGTDGWNPEMWRNLDKVRAFQRELWEIALNQSEPANKEPI